MRIRPTHFDRKCQTLPPPDRYQSQFGYAGMNLFLLTMPEKDCTLAYGTHVWTGEPTKKDRLATAFWLGYLTTSPSLQGAGTPVRRFHCHPFIPAVPPSRR